MNQRNGLHVVLGMIGLAALLFYILACRPSWSPDSSKILFPYQNPETEEAGIALFDRNTGTVSSIFVPSKDCKDCFPSVEWDSDGSRAIVTWVETKEKIRKKAQAASGEQGKKKATETIQIKVVHVSVLPVGEKGNTRNFTLRDWEGDDTLGFWPPPEVDGKLYFGVEGSFTRLDLKTGRTKVRHLGDKRMILFFDRDAGRIAYARDGPENSDDMEFGNLDQKKLTLRPLFVLKIADLAHYGVKEIGGFIAFEPHGSRLALPGEGEKEGKAFLIFCNDSGLQYVVAPELPAKAFKLGNLQWAWDGKTIYALVVTPTEDTDFQQYSLGEIPVGGGPARLVPIVRIKASSDDSPIMLQIALSPDGSAIAVGTAHLEKDDIKAADRGLFLVDLRGPERKVTKIPFPRSPKADNSKPKE